MKKVLVCVALLLFSLALVTGCDSEDNGGNDLTYNNGTYTAVSTANDRGYVEATITIENDEITAVTTVEFNDLGDQKDWDSYPYAEAKEGHDAVAADIVENNTWDVDIYSGATTSSNKIMEAVKNAMEKALVTPTSDNEYFDGTFMAISEKGDRGWGIAWVTIENDEITEVVLKETAKGEDESFERKSEEYAWEQFHEAVEAIADAIIEAQSAEVDAYTGATGSSNMWMDAVQNALDSATR